MTTATIPALDEYTADEIAELLTYLSPDEQEQLNFLLTAVQVVADDETDYSVYADDPVRFGIEVFGETYTPDQIRVMESVRDNPVTIARSANAVGKTHVAARTAVWWHKCCRQGGYSQVYTAAAPPERNLRDLLWGEINALVNKHPHVFEADKTLSLKISDRDDPRNSITGVTIPQSANPATVEASFAGKHAPNLLFILDEADAIPDAVYKGIESCLSGDNGRMLVMYNPRSNEGAIAAMIERGVPVITLSAFDHPNVITGEDVFPGAVSRNKTLHRIWQWTVPVDESSDKVQGYGRFTVPEFLVGAVGENEETREPYPPLPAGERVIVVPEFCYMVLGIYAGAAKGIVYDTFSNEWATYRQKLAQVNGRLLQRIESVERFPLTPDDLPGWETAGNVSPFYDYEEGAGAVFWSIDDGYAGAIDPHTGMFTRDSHPRVIGFYQYKPNGDVVRFDELAMLREPQADRQMRLALERPYPSPEFVVHGPGAASLGGQITQTMGLYKRGCMTDVEESVKHLRQWISADDKGHRRFKVHPRCKHFLYEVGQYRRDDNGRLIKGYDHCLDEARYFCWVVRNGL